MPRDPLNNNHVFKALVNDHRSWQLHPVAVYPFIVFMQRYGVHVDEVHVGRVFHVFEKSIKLIFKLRIKSPPRRSMACLRFPHSSYISVKIRAYMIKFMKYNSQLFDRRKIKKSWRVKIYYIKQLNTVAHDPGYGIIFPIMAQNFLAVFKS